MTKTWWAKLVVLLFFIGMAGVYVYPTLSNLDVEKSKFPFKQKINLGLDLQGGLYMVLGVDFNKVFKEVVSRQVSSLRDGLKDKGINAKRVEFLKEGGTAEDPRLIVEFDAAKRDELYDLIKKSYWTLRLAAEKPGVFELGLSTEYRSEVRDNTINQSIEVIRNRIDEFGVAEPVISSQGSDRVVVELPGVKDIDRAKDLIGRTAKLEFRIVNTKAMDPGKVAELVATIEKDHKISYKEGTKFSEYVRQINEKAKGKIPADSEIAFEKISGMERVARARNGEESKAKLDKEGEKAIYNPYLLFARAEVTGDDLEDAQVSFDQDSRMPNVSFSLNPRGADAFDKLTGEHVNDFLAIVLDNIVHSAPRINGRIPGGRGQITLGRGNQEDILREAKDLAIVLRAGALPAQLEFLEQRVVGPSLGQDSIQKGAKAGVVGILAIFIFMIFYYRGSGLVATFSLLLNALFILAILVGIEATLTLPGIAGIALTIGMAVDSNVIIFERIRDELSEGKSVLASVEAGFGKAFSAIFDANITHGIIAVILMTYGTGPIRGFAISLLIGIFTTLFCAVTVAKLLFDGYLSAKPDMKKLSI